MSQRLSCALAILGALTFCPPAAAQLSAGGGIAGYGIYAVDGSGEWLGVVVVIPDTITLPPKGFDAGREYWYFRPDKGMPTDFVLIDGYLDAGDCGGATSTCTLKVDGLYVPSTPSAYLAYDHEAFDLTAPMMFPTVAPGTLDTAVYDVDIDIIDTGLSSTGLGAPLAWFSFSTGSQRAWAATAAVTTERIAPLDASSGLLFLSSTLPAAKSVKVYEAN